ncbi:MAG: glycosyltransferase family 4 protein [Vicingaceae bacterium]
MKILLLTQYFPPEVGAPQNRLFELAIRLKASGVEVDVLTAMPNYPSMLIHDEYKGRFTMQEEMGGMKVLRSWIFVSQSKSILPRLLNYFSFVFTSFFVGNFKLGKYDYVFCESPPLFLGLSAYALSVIKRAGLIFNVSDLWPESAEKLDIIRNKFLLNSATVLEEFLYKKAVLVTGQTQGIVANISSRFPEKECYWLPNGVDLSYYNPVQYDRSWREKLGLNEGDIALAYAGIHGHAQGLEVILKAAALLQDQPHLKFFFLGSGPEKKELIELNESLGNTSVQFLDVIGKGEMPFFISAIDVSIIPLKNIPLFEGAIPSKIFESLSMKKPILLGVKGEAKELFIERGKAGKTFIPENEVSLKEEILSLSSDPGGIKTMGENGRKYVELAFNRDTIATAFVEVLENIK